jgi:suppressor of G2 allele of SKP1
LELEPSNGSIWEARAHAHIKLEQYVEAAADALKAIELDPGLAKAYLRKG